VPDSQSVLKPLKPLSVTTRVAGSAAAVLTLADVYSDVPEQSSSARDATTLAMTPCGSFTSAPGTRKNASVARSGLSNAVGSVSTGAEGVAVDANCAATSSLHDVGEPVATTNWLQEDFGSGDLACVFDDDE
jgi:hypothetical protein